jgi:hypothetical protein
VCLYIYTLARWGDLHFLCLPAHSTGRSRLLRKHKDLLFRDEKEDEDRTIIDLEWSNRAWVVVFQLPPLIIPTANLESLMMAVTIG